MLNAKQMKALPADVRAVYTSGVHIQTADILYAVQQHVRSARNKSRSRAVDLLVSKLMDFGNTGEWARAKAVELAKEIFRTDKGAPKGGTDGQWYSIEFECIFNDPKAVDDFVREVRIAGFTNLTTVKTDGSVARNDRDRTGEPREVVFSYMRGNEASVHKLCSLLKGRAYVNKTCGTHVHFDMRGKDEAAVKLAGGRLARYVPVLKRMLPESRRNNQYCKDTINGIGNRGSRYAFVNLHSYGKHQTLEVRGHSGTISAAKILNWIQICDTIMNKRTRATEDVTTTAQLAGLYGFDAELTTYMAARETEFANTTAHENEDRVAA